VLKVVKHSSSSESWSNYRPSCCSLTNNGLDRCCSLIGRVNDHERADESNVQGEFNGGPGRTQREQWGPSWQVMTINVITGMFDSDQGVRTGNPSVTGAGRPGPRRRRAIGGGWADSEPACSRPAAGIRT
jgi:hypothetical protein